MKRIFLTACLAALVTLAKGQYVPNNGQGYQFMPLFNPAFSGIENFTDVKLGYRYQWSGFGKNAPRFVNLAMNLRLKQPLDVSYNSSRVSSMSNARTRRLPAGKRIIHGLGVNVFQSSIGVLRSVGGALNYSIHYPVSDYTRIAFGLASLLENRKLDVTQLSVRDPDDYYNFLLRSSTSQTDLNVRAGLLLYTDNFYVGFSYLPLVNKSLASSDLAMEETFYKASFQTGLSFQINDEVSLKPSIIGLLTVKGKMIMDYNVKAYLEDKVFFGLGYRSSQSGVALLGFNINERVTASYSYELSVGQFRKFNDGSHELVLSARFKNLKRDQQYTW